MRVSAPAAAAALSAILAGCAPRPVVVAPVDATARLAAAETLVAEGCYDCLVEALAAFDRIAATEHLTPASADGAAAGQVRAAVLLNLRERELGMLDEGYRQRARDVLAAHPDLAATLGPPIEILDSVAWRIPEASGVSDDDRIRAGQEARQHRDEWTAALQPHAGDDAFSAYAWLAYACSAAGRPRSNADDVRAIYAPVEPQAAARLVQFKQTICPIVETPELESLLAADPRFVEINYYRSLALTRGGQLDKADEYLAAAYAWHPRWPAVVLARAGIAISQEDFARALGLYDETLALLPGQRDALLGRVESLSYLGRNEDAIAAATTVLAGDWYRGEAYYWRAWNETQLERNDAAWADIDAAWKLYVNGDVAKLYGILALHRLDLDKAQAMFEEGRRLKPDDCEISYYLGLVYAERRDWTTTADIFSATGTCLDVSRVALRTEIDRLQVSENIPADRRARQIASRERQFQTEGRMLATSWFNVSVSSFNLSRMDAARAFAERVADDEQYGARAREILSRLSRPDK